MSYMSELAIDLEQRQGRIEWAVLTYDESRPAALWQVIGETKGKTILKHPKLPIQFVEPSENVWVIA